MDNNNNNNTDKNEQRDREAKAAARASARAVRPGAVSVASDEAARLDRRIQDKQARNASPPRGSQQPPPRSLDRLEQDIQSKRQAAAAAGGSESASRPGAFSVSRASSASTSGMSKGASGAGRAQLDALEAKVAAKQGQSSPRRSAPAAAAPGAHAALNDLEDRINAKVRANSPNRARPSSSSANSPRRAPSPRRNAPATAPGAVAALNDLEDRINAKVRANSPARSNSPLHPRPGNSPIRAQTSSPRRNNNGSPLRGTQSSPRRSTSPLRGAVSSSSMTSSPSRRSPRHTASSSSNSVVSGVASLNQVEDRIAAKIRRDGGSSSSSMKPAPAPTNLQNMEDAIAAKQQGFSRGSAAAPAARSSKHQESIHTDARVTAKNSMFGGHAVTQEQPAPAGLKKGGDDYDQDEDDVLAAKSGGKVEDYPEQAPTDKDGGVTADPLAASPAQPAIYGPNDLEYGVYDAENTEGLAVAVPVMEEDEDVFIPSAVEYDPDAKPPIYHNRRFRLYAFLAVFVLVLTAIGASVGVSVGKKGSTYEDPLAYREELGIRESLEQVVGAEVLDDKTSAYARALNWITFQDPLQMTPESASFLQRYIAAYFYYATTEKHPWNYCNPAGENEDATCMYDRVQTIQPITYITNSGIRWLSEFSECRWVGIFCDQFEQIRAIDLNGANMTGTFPEGIHHLPYVQSLGLALGKLRGQLPKQVANMKHLVNIELHYNSFSGTIPEEWYSARSLQRLNVGSNNIGGQISPAVKNMRDVKGLYFFENQMTGSIPSEIGSLKSLSFIRFQRNHFDGTIPSEMGNLGEQMHSIWMYGNKLEGSIPSEFAQMNKMEDFRVHDNPRLGGRIPTEMLTRLDRLDLFNCNFTDDVGPMFDAMTQMNSMRIHNNNFYGTIPADLGERLPYLISLWMSGNDISGTVPDSVCALRSDDLGLDELVADCLPPADGVAPELTCRQGCCTECCNANGEGCVSMGGGR